MKTSKQQTGNWGENVAENFLLNKGFEIRERNYRFKKAEVDLIVFRNGLLVFVEVKVRRSARFGFPETFASTAQLRRIKSASEQYQIENQYNGFIRFDIISILGSENSFELSHFEDAF